MKPAIVTHDRGEHDAEVRRNVVVLATAMAMSWSVVQLVAALGAVTFKHLTHEPSLAGFAPGAFLASWAASSIGVGRFMDRHGRAAGLRLAFAIGFLGSLVAYVGAWQQELVLFLGGIALLGVCCGGVNLARTGAADMYPPEKRARGISYVLIGAAAGAILSPLIYTPILGGARNEIVFIPWLAAAALLGAGAIATFAVRVDPMRLPPRAVGSDANAAPSPSPSVSRRSLSEILRAPGVAPALYAAVVAQAVMASFMTIIGLSMVSNGHALTSITLTMSAHFAGMFGLVLVVGRIVERIGRARAMVSGLLTLAGGLLMLSLSGELYCVIPGMFIIGMGWNIAFVASTAVLADAARPSERAGLLGFNDFAAVGLAAPGVVSAALLLGSAGLTALVLAGTAVVLTPLVPLLTQGVASAMGTTQREVTGTPSSTVTNSPIIGASAHARPASSGQG